MGFLYLVFRRDGMRAGDGGFVVAESREGERLRMAGTVITRYLSVEGANRFLR
jgi:hypothetical protein